MTKRLFDSILSFCAITLLWPLMLLVAICIKFDTMGPAMYRGRRTGLHGKAFDMLKFRTMVNDADQIGGPSTGKNDPRITKVGTFLRRYKLDELPQLFNVLKGDMSIVGPRPEVPQYTDLYTGDELLILTVRPGITDYSSIRFSSLDETLGAENPDQVYEEQIKPIKNMLRIKYVKEHTFWGDISIIMATILTLGKTRTVRSRGTIES